MLEISVKKKLGDNGKIGHNGFSLDVSFAVEGGITVLLGASGSGKTTTLRLIAGIVAPDAGIIKINSQTYFDSTANINLSIQQRRVGFVFQDYALFPHLNAAQNVAYGIKNNDRRARFAEAEATLAQFGIGHLRERLPREMSGGERQRVALARALASAPLIVLLDEPLSAVDVETRAELLDEIEKAQRRTSIPFVYVTHNQVEAERLGRQRITLRDGRVSEQSA